MSGRSGGQAIENETLGEKLDAVKDVVAEKVGSVTGRVMLNEKAAKVVGGGKKVVGGGLKGLGFLSWMAVKAAKKAASRTVMPIVGTITEKFAEYEEEHSSQEKNS
jgi:hypothetical protein